MSDAPAQNDEGSSNVVAIAGHRSIGDAARAIAAAADMPSAVAIETVDDFRQAEANVLAMLDLAEGSPELAVDRRFLAIGRTQIELGFMAVNRAILKPARVPPTPPVDAPIVETGWVLERADSPAAKPMYYAPSGHHISQWTPNHERALRLARRKDAATLAAGLGVEVRVAEHQWDGETA